MATSLPQVNSPLVQRIADEDPNYLSAYNVCLNYERELTRCPDKQRYVRILGFLLLYAPNRGVRAEVTRCIHSRKDNSDLSNVGALFECNVILPFIKYKSRTPEPSEYSNSSFEAVEEGMKVDITQTPKNHKDVKQHALIRDKWRCTTTGILDCNSLLAKHDLTQVAVNTQCAYIIPEATFFGAYPKSIENTELNYSATVLAILKQFHYDIDMFSGNNIHSLVNAMTLQADVHDTFDRLELYFEAMSQPNHYQVKWLYNPPHENMPQFVTFSTPDPVNLPVPSPKLLALHATFCRVAHFSGAAKYIEEVYQDAEDSGVLSADGTSADMLKCMMLSLWRPEL